MIGPLTDYYGDEVAQALDLFRPRAAPRGVLALLHGGGWVSGQRADLHHLARPVTGAGWTLACLGYRLAPAAEHPSQIQDAAAAVAWLLAEEVGDGLLVLGGHSAGAHLAALLAVDGSWLAAEGVDRRRLGGLVGLSGVYDLVRAAKVRWMLDRWIRPTFGDDETVWRDASPVARVAAPLPPAWLNNAEVDWGLHRHATTLEEAWLAAGGRVTRTITPDTHHITVLRDMAAPDNVTTRRLLEFLADLSASR